ncbi:MAG: hypothetical protein Fur0012_03440 [Elusimicrobiota bacterium]
MRKLRIFSEISILGLIFELLLISFVFFSLGYISNRADPLLINSEINILLILVSVITLFYGLFSGVLVMAAVGFGLYHFYKPFPYNYFVNNLLFMLIFSEFHYFWNRTLKKMEKQNEYIEMKLSELTRNFYSLKLSHDQLEKSYILKPNSLRNILQQIKNLYLENPAGAYDELLTVISKNYGIKKAAIFTKKGEQYSKISAFGTENPLNEDSRVLKNALETMSPSYLSKFEDIKMDYLAALPALDSSDNLNFIMVVEDMQFLQFNKDIIFSIWVIINYFSDFISHVNLSSDIIKKHPHCPSEFLVELKRLAHIRKKLEIKSLILTLKIKKSGVGSEDVNSFIAKNLRGIDMTCFKNDMIFILFPLVSYSNIQPVIEKIEKQVSDKFSLEEKGFSYKILEVLDDASKTAEYILEIAQRENEPN